MIALWAVLPPYTGPELATEMRVEIADHVVPATLLLVLSVAALVRRRRAGSGDESGSFMLIAGLGILLAGFWMVATHVPLVAQARRGELMNEAGKPSNWVAVYHTTPGVIVLLFGLVWTALHWDDPAPDA